MDDPELRMSFDDGAALAKEFEQNLQHGRAYVQGPADVGVLSDCMLVIVHPDDGAELALSAQAVMVSPAGVGIELRPFDQSVADRMRGFVEGEREPAAQPEPHEGEVDCAADGELDAEVEDPTAAPSPAQAPWPGSLSDPPDAAVADRIGDGEQAGLEASMPSVLPSAPPDASAGEDDQAAAPADLEDDDAPHEGEQAEEEQPDGEQDDDESRPSMVPETERQAGPSRQEKLRKLSQVEQQKIARRGELNDRVMLERIYGKNVWDSLLRNPRLTIPEVARIARKGTVPRPLIELIIDNNAWIQAATVRRALLSNPRVTPEGIMRLMRITPKHELKSIMKSTAYSIQVRDAAKKVHG
jgi:hypothetical protein